MCMRIMPAPVCAAISIIAASASKADTSLIMSAPAFSAWRATSAFVVSMEMGTLDPTVWAVYVTISNPFLTSEDACGIIREATGIAGMRCKYNVEREQASDSKAT